MLLTGRWQKLTQIVLDHRLIENWHFARERGAYAAVPTRASCRIAAGSGAERPAIPKYSLIVRLRRLDIGDDLRLGANV